jgi:hypothetical protein
MPFRPFSHRALVCDKSAGCPFYHSVTFVRGQPTLQTNVNHLPIFSRLHHEATFSKRLT